MATAQTIVDSYNLLRQHLADSRPVIARVRTQIETEYQQALNDATNEYNRALGSLDMIHANLDDAQTQLTERKADAQACNTRQHTELLRTEARIRDAEPEGRAHLARARLSPADTARIAHDPPPIIFAMRVYDLKALDTLRETIKQNIHDLEIDVREYRHERHAITRMRGIAKPFMQPTVFASVLLGFYYALFLWHDPFWKGDIGGIYWLYEFFDVTWIIALAVILGLYMIGVRHIKGCMFALAAPVFLYIIGLILVLSMPYIFSGPAKATIGNTTNANHKYMVVAESNTNWETASYINYSLFECDTSGIFCRSVKSDWNFQFNRNGTYWDVIRDPADPTKIIVRYNGQVLMRFPDCGKYCILPEDYKRS